MQPTNALITRVQSGYAWSADTQIQALALLSYLRIKIANTGNQNAYIYAFGVFNGGATDSSLKVYKDPTTTVTANVVTPINQNMASNNTSTLTVTYDTNVADASGGSLYRTIPAPSKVPQIITDQVILLPPGHSLIMSVQALIAANQLLHLDWFEQPN
jgi:hypothetical protein